MSSSKAWGRSIEVLLLMPFWPGLTVESSRKTPKARSGYWKLLRNLPLALLALRGLVSRIYCVITPCSLLVAVPSAPELPPVQSVQQQQAEQMKVYWKVRICLQSNCTGLTISTFVQFIEGMLTNLGALPLDRIQTMLKYAPGYDRSIEQLAAFMEAARREGLVTGRDGQWRLNTWLIQVWIQTTTLFLLCFAVPSRAA